MWVSTFAFMRYLVKTPWWLRKVYSSYVWNMPSNSRDLYFTFDDGPHPSITEFVLGQLKLFQARASFFCIGNNVRKHSETFNRIIAEGHSVGNHTNNHLNGWKVSSSEYLDDAKEAGQVIDSNLFRPPYGRILRSQAKKIPLAIQKADAKIIMWDVLSGDFDVQLSKEQCLRNVIDNCSPGSIVVFHDSEKAYRLLEYTLPRVLDFFATKEFQFKNLSSLQKN